MTKPLTVLKASLIAALLIGLVFCYLFFRVWQKNEGPDLISQAWSADEVVLGDSVTLTINVEVPWHREFVDAAPFSHPDFLVPVRDEATFSKGSLSPLGTRNWTLTVPFVATDTKPVDGLAPSFSLKGTDRVSPNAVDVPLPPLQVNLPVEIPETPDAPGEFLTEEEPPRKITIPPIPEQVIPLWAWVAIAILVAALIIFLLKKTGIIKTTPPWEKALGNLARLDPGTEPVPFYSRLTDILKQYTAERYALRARSKTSAEFLEIIKDHPDIPKDQLEELAGFARLADAVKFADHTPDSTKAPTFLGVIRDFVTKTTPADEEKERA